MPFFGKQTKRSGLPEWDGQAFDLDDQRIPAEIREAASNLASPADKLYFVETAAGGEWWLIDATGELIESFWLEA